jgi:predicted amidophosphoribosyltransferase
MRTVLDFLVPRTCAICRAAGALVCSACRAALPRLTPPVCARCGALSAWPVARCSECAGRRLAFASARAAVAYDARVRTFVAAWKERGLRALADFAAAIVVEVVARPRVALLSWVPSDPGRVRQRGHHPPERLARALAALWELPAVPLLTRTRASPRQRGLSPLERRRNVAGAFAASGEAASRVALVDDVYTTGATANAAASALRKGGARRVEVLTLARTIRIR